ncbi:MAG: rhomboid family intramembrane serine protease [Lentisphaerae bacterium]|jgi:membrane associated rhomboid family serine protease|nr:rhomboid family intramembrane serine protease [Lentisphaerota bacterium]MBT4816081.1 rhomboid family intramembrane serine protease [Lentisphaerota bacterium]MBT5613166.1 rhomboid family intramembrane serine protease [Lentisphaerota bacterium]MBT7061950.1 rhomboid family intramembrane serine protease [Lentisphaerota bacterium]MBT7844542.1 rhomboid family intramembrane serine protease [Lentisphaerota bacterium]
MFLPLSIDIEEPVIRRRRAVVVVYTILLLCTAVHLWLTFQATQVARTDAFYRWGAMRFRFRWWTPITCTFLHGGWGHLLGNMYFLWIYGREVERRFGYVRFTAIYILGAVFSAAAQLLTLSPFSADVPMIGASGAVSAVLGAFLMFWPTSKLRCAFFSIFSFRPIIVVLPAWTVLGLWFSGQLLYSLELVGRNESIAFWAHVAGFVVGAAVATWFGRRQQQQEAQILAAFRAPMTEAWESLLGGRHAEAARTLPLIDDVAIGDMRGSCHFARGLVAIQRGDYAAGAVSLPRAFSQARDYRNGDAALTIYLQMIKHMDAEEIPAAMHRDAGFVAQALRCPDVMLWAFSQALSGGCSEGGETMLRATQAELRRREVALQS